MRAWTVSEPDRIELLSNAQPPTLTEAGQALIRVRATATNFADGLMIDGSYQERPDPPFVPGIEVAGDVLESTSTRHQPGDRVVGLTVPGHGGWADVAVSWAHQIVSLPDSIAFTDAIGLFVNAQTAWFALHRRACLTTGMSVLVQAAAGGVGSMATQLALVAGCEVIAVTSERKQPAVAALGATHILARSADWPTEVMAITAGRGVDVVIDPVGGEAFTQSLRTLAFEGQLVCVGFASGHVPTPALNHVLVKNVTIHGLYWTRYCADAPDIVADATTAITDLHSQGRLSPMVTSVLPLDEALQSLQPVRDGTSIGKHVLTTARAS